MALQTRWTVTQSLGRRCSYCALCGFASLRLCVESLVFLFLITLTACGGGGGGAPTSSGGPATISGTLAYVVSECRENAQEETARQALRIQQAEAVPVTVAELDFGPLPAQGLCPLFGLERVGIASVAAAAFQRIAVSPDGTTVVFEISDDFSIQAPNQLVSPGDEGIFAVRSDGSGLRRLAAASRDPSFRVAPDPSAPGGVGGQVLSTWLGFSPDGRRITFNDIGPDNTGEDAVQIVTIDLTTGERAQQTRLPPLQSGSPFYPSVLQAWFLDNERLQFSTFTVPGETKTYTLRADGSGTLTERVPIPIPGTTLVPNFSITGAVTAAFALVLPGMPVNQLPHLAEVRELFVEAGDNLLQLTSFHRSDTAWSGPQLSGDGQRVLFQASADPFGTNPNQNCQIFSINPLGVGLRQLTFFDEGAHSAGGCDYAYPPGCLTWFQGVDRRTDVVVLYSSCDPFGTNPYGGQIFAMHFDGSGLRQISNLQGMHTEPDGTVSVELPGPIAYEQQR